MTNWKRLEPFAIGAALVGVGAVLSRISPSALALPGPRKSPRDYDWSGRRELAGKARDGLATVAPRNLTDSIGRSLIIAGVALVAIRALDEIALEDFEL